MSASDVAIIGGGLMGLALARKYTDDGRKVTVYESDTQLGGLATWHDYGDFTWDRFYHVILPSDRSLIRFINDIGLGDELEWRRTYTGFYVDERLHSISSNIEFLKFPLLSILDKARLAWTMLYGSRINDWQRLEKIRCEDWLVRVSGRSNYEKLWKPLLLAKLGANYERVSAVFIWSYIKRLFSARDASASSESLGHVRGGYRRIFERLEERIRGAGGEILLRATVDLVEPTGKDGIRVHSGEDSHTYARVICTSPVSVLTRIAAPGLVDVTSGSGGIEYLGVVCVTIKSRDPVVPYYVVNIADDRIPFTGIIGMSNVVSTDQTEGLNLTYLPKYMLSTDPEFEKEDAYFEEMFLDGLKTMLPQFDMSSIVSVHVNRARIVQPLQVLGYSHLVPKVSANHPRLHVLNTSQFVNATLNNNEVIAAVEDFYSRHGRS